jgi:flagellum-specific peptidoglycan hydrolase FlgJ
MSREVGNNWDELVEIAREHLPFPEKINDVVIAQWALESDFGKSELAEKYNNYAGLKWRPKRLKNVSAYPISYKAHDGTDRYCAFEELIDFVLGYVDFIRYGPYDWNNIPMDDQRKYLQHLNDHGYSGVKDYADRVMRLLTNG